ncbi:MAG TPA: ATP-binding protein [Pseudomonas sp.]|jgi:two-component system sensor histidine kinase BaeS|uniref:ATP-binding protein n=1 Tax=Pseudomonas sp. TaxID=306 RepID=UPI002EDB0DC9
MKLSISTKLFLAIMAGVTLVILSMSMATSWSFGRGFLGYLNEQALLRLEPILPRLERTWQRDGNWESLRDKPENWFDLLRPVKGEDLAVNGEWRAPPISDLTGAVFRVALFDQNKALVMGYPGVADQALLRPINVAGNTVGWLAVIPFQSVSEAGGQRFEAYQLRVSLGMGIVSLLLAMLIAWWIARTLLTPVKQVAAATHRLASGHYAERVSVSANDEVGQLARDFNQLALTLESNERLRREFMADVSHELRTPLAVMRGELEAIEDGVRQLDIDSMQSLQGEVSMLSKLVDDLYELSLADVGALTYRKNRLDLVPLLSDSAAMFFERRKACGIDLQLVLPDAPLSVQGDDQRLRQLMNNLLENAMRYTDQGGTLRIEARHEGQSVRVDIQDSAPGVSNEQLPRLFERFYRGEGSRSRSSGGAGLGLAICRSIAVAHGGTLEAAHSPLGGVWLTLILPRDA